MNHIIDIILVAVILLNIFIASKRGIILTVLDLASGVFAFLGAKMFAPTASVFLYNTFAKEAVMTFLTEKYVSAGNAISQGVNNLASVFDFLPDGVLAYVQNAGFLDGAVVSQNVMNSVITVEELETVIVSPVITAFLQLIAFAVLAFVFLVILRVVSRFVSKVITISKITDKLNSILGAVFGLLKGFVYMFIIAALLSVIACSSETIAAYAADSYICSLTSQLIGI
ncbi:MAG: CvpA family protein [Clostridia bacterium]|nr:CvpA family protein [Clostridia bacterium]